MFHNRRLLRAAVRHPFVAAGPAEDALTTAWAAAVVSAGGAVSSPRRTIVDTLAAGLRSDGLVTILDRLWLLAAANTQQTNIDLINLGTWTATGAGVTSTADIGTTSNGSDSINTNFTPSTAGGHYTQNSAHISAYVRNNRGGASWAAIGVNDGGQFSYLEQYDSSNNFSGDINGSSFPNAAQTSSHGMWIVTRTSSTNVDKYKNGAGVAGGSAGDASGTIATIPFHIFKINTFGHQGQDVIAAITIGGSLNSTQAAALSNRINAYMTSLGINVY